MIPTPSYCTSYASFEPSRTNARPWLVVAAAGFVLAAAAPGLCGDCEQWLAGAMVNDTSNNGADQEVYTLGSWSPDGNPSSALLIAGGAFSSVQGTPAKTMALYNSATGQWSALGDPNMGPLGEFTGVYSVFSYNNELYVGGTPGPNGSAAVRWTGSFWETLDTDCTINDDASPQTVKCFATYNGDLIAGGTFSKWFNSPSCVSQEWGLMRWENGAWRSFTDFVSGEVRALINYNGNLIAAGMFTQDTLGNPGDYIVSWNGTEWDDMNTGATGPVEALAVYNGELIAGGNFNAIGSIIMNRIGRWNGSQWQSMGSGISGSVSALAVYNGELYAGGYFNAAGGVSAMNIARWNGLSWQSVGSGLGQFLFGVDSLFVHDGRLIAGGRFTTSGDGQQSLRRLAAWDGTQWAPFGGGTMNQIEALTAVGSKLYLGGNFQQSTVGQPANHVALWDGQVLRPLGKGMNTAVFTLKGYVLGSTNQVVAGGNFIQAGDVAASRVARWIEPSDGSAPGQWHPMGSGFVNAVYAVERFNGSTIAAGAFLQTGGLTRIARWNEQVGAWGPMGLGMNSVVRTLEAYNLPFQQVQLVAGGTFTTAGGVAANRIARWTEHLTTPGNPAWAPMGEGFNGTVETVERHDGFTYAGGTFTMSGATPVARVARWTGTSWVTVGGGFNNTVRELRSINGYLYAAGDFTTADGLPANHLARWNGSSWQAVEGGADAAVNALEGFGNAAHIGGFFTSVNNGAVSSPGWAMYVSGSPLISLQPVAQTVACSETAIFTVNASGDEPLQYQWRRNGFDLADGPTGTGSTIAGSATASLTINNVSSDDQATYDVVVSNECASATSFARSLTVTDAETCQPCIGEFNGDGTINVSDLLTLLAAWGPCTDPGNCPADLNGDDTVNVTDLLQLLSNWGGCQ